MLISYPKGNPQTKEVLDDAIKYRLDEKLRLSGEFLKRDNSRLGIEAALGFCFEAIFDAIDETEMVRKDERTGIGEYVL